MTAQAAEAARKAAEPTFIPAGTPKSFGPTLQEARHIPQQKRAGRRPAESPAWSYDPWEDPTEQGGTGAFYQARDVFARAGEPTPQPTAPPTTTAGQSATSSGTAAQASAAPQSFYTRDEINYARDVYNTHTRNLSARPPLAQRRASTLWIRMTHGPHPSSQRRLSLMTLGKQRIENASSKLLRRHGRRETQPTSRRHPSSRLNPEAPLPPRDEKVSRSSPRRPHRVVLRQAGSLRLWLRRP